MSRRWSKLVPLLALFIAWVAWAGAVTAADITFLTPLWNEDARNWYENEIIPAFKRLYPDINVEIEYTDWNGMRDRIAVEIAAGVGADVIVTTGEGSARSQGEQGILRPLDEYLRNWDGLEDTLPYALEVQRIDGKTYAVPNTVNLRTYAVNVSLMERAGFDPHAPLGSWRDWVELLRRLSGVYDYQEIAAFRATNGGQYVEGVFTEAAIDLLDENRLLNMNTPEAQEVLQHLHDVFQASGGVLHEGTPEIFRQGNQLGNGTVAIGWVGNYVTAMRNLGPGSIALPDPVRQTAMMPATGLGITTVSKNPDAAWKWIEFLSEPENQIRFNDFYGRIPPRFSAIQTSPAMEETPLFRRAAEIAVQFGRPTPFSNQYGSFADLRNEIANIISAMLRGDAQPSQVAMEIELLWNNRVQSR